jgi:hypothetical protein
MSITYKNYTLSKLSLSISEASKFAGFNEKYLKRLIHSGQIDIIAPPNFRRFKVSSISLIDFIIANSINLNNIKELL